MDILNSKKIKSALSEGVDVICLHSVDSTSDYAERLVKGGKEGDFLVVANRQTSGHGRSGKSFFSDRGGIYFTFVVTLDCKIDCAVTLTSRCALCVLHALGDTVGVDAKIKWVNDVFLDGKKICGILIKKLGSTENGKTKVAIGIGINTHRVKIPQDLTDTAGKLPKTKAKRNDVISAIVNEILACKKSLGDTAYIDEYRKNSLVIGKKIYYIKDNKRYDAVAVDIDSNCRLIVDVGERREILDSGEITLRVK